jgi:FtsP/CotA-like multicopper oxidase with cupredoxin domain
LKGALVGSAAAALGGPAAAFARRGRGRGRSGSGDGDVARTPIRFRPFEADLPIPPVLAPVAPFEPACDLAGNSPAPFPPLPTVFYAIEQRPGIAEIIPGVETPIWGYEGIYPGPTILARIDEPVIVRQTNALPTEVVVHLHGAHAPAPSDGFPTDFVFPGQSRDYCYPNFAPDGDVGEAMSTAWYHDHAMDITGRNVYAGLAAFYLLFDDLEEELIADGRLPGHDFDVPVVLQDRTLNADGTLHFNPFEIDGFLGDLMVANGKVQPRFTVQRRKYRFRFLNGANARMFMLRLSNGAPFLQVATDSWLLPFAIEQRRVLLGMAERADLVIDFRNAPDEVFLENILVQDDGRGPDGDREDPEVRIPGVPLVKFVVEGPNVADDATTAPGDLLRPHTPIDPRSVVRTRRFEYERRGGEWVINDRLFDPERADASPRLGEVERWILENGGGGWWHPVHIHLEAMHVQRINGRLPPAFERFNKDTINLGPNDVAEVLIRFRDFPGRYVQHCHNIEHEDHRMMSRFDVVLP